MTTRASLILGALGGLLVWAHAAVAQPAPPTPARIDDGTIDGADAGTLGGYRVPAGLSASDDGGTLVISAVEAGGPWKALGLRAGDVVIAMNGHLVTTMASFEAGLLTVDRVDVIYVEVERGNKPVLLRRVVKGGVVRAATPSPDPAIEAALTAMITHRGGTVWEVDADALLADPMRFAKGARVVPSVKNGKPDGLKLYAIRPSSAYARLGLRNGDTVVRIGGRELTTPDQALEIYASVRDADKVVVEIVRRGKPVTHTYLRKKAAKAAPRKP